MPELPEVETVRRGLLPVLAGHRLAVVEQRRSDLRFPLPVDFARRLAGRRIENIERRGKYLLIRLDADEVWLAHLGMSGRFCIDGPDTPAPGPHDHVLLRTDSGVCVRFHDPRRFGFMDLVPAEALDRCPHLAGLGPDPLGPAFDGAYLAGSLAARRTPLKAALLDQRVVAGMGNIYASESLFRARLSPARMAATVGGKRVDRLVAAIKEVFAEAIAAGGSSLRDHRQPSGELGFFQHGFAVYGRAGEPCPGCRCQPARTGGIRRIVQSGRSTFYCGLRQR
ncbi:MAG: bifunctional DNA-formamidopyrimidine glycosylase/DNA-(apurinic or apyrimidinic site) lyase [Rhodospirillales bacterium]|nr:bifunctional DNA-formamidopyrimidine glycosylase/DNA-(apurinic or apyrimidinic site) lyase [Rhodospirillales bacterium]